MSSVRPTAAVLAFSLAAAGLLACAAASPPGESPEPAAPAPEATPGEGPAAGAPLAGGPEDSPGPDAPKPLRDAETSEPEGLSPLSPDERKVLESDCKKLSEVVAKAVAKTKVDPVYSRTEQTLAALENPPKIKELDVPKCVALMKRDLTVFDVRQAETEAKNNLKMMAVNLGVAFQDGKKLCPSAGPTPATLDALKSGRVATSAADWSAPGWSCVRFGLSTAPTRWQYELRTQKGAGTWEIVARGFPVKGAPPTELVIGGVIDSEGPTPPGALKRR